MSNVNCTDCTMDVYPPDVLSPGKKFSDIGIHDHQMPFFVTYLADCSPEEQVKTAINGWPPLTAAVETNAVVDMLETLLLGVVGWPGTCMAAQCCK